MTVGMISDINTPFFSQTMDTTGRPPTTQIETGCTSSVVGLVNWILVNQ